MKRIMTIIAASLAAAVACNKESIEMPDNQVNDEFKVTVRLETAATKALNIVESNESKVNNVQIYVFNDTGALESYDKSANGEVVISVSKGQREFYALVNADDVKVSSKTELLGKTSALSSNQINSFEMIGSVSKEIKADDDIEIRVKRIVSKVIINKISRQFISESQGAVEMSIDAIYLNNVAGDTDYSVSAAPQTWYNKMAYQSSAVDALIYDGGIGYGLDDKSDYSAVHSFYPYPNPTEADANGGTWSPRHTKLVIKTTYGGSTKFYPITLPELERNKTYTITDLILTRPGSDDEDIPVSAADCHFSIVVEDWETGGTYTETI